MKKEGYKTDHLNTLLFWHSNCLTYKVGLPISQKKAKHFECLAESLLGERSENFKCHRQTSCLRHLKDPS